MRLTGHDAPPDSSTNRCARCHARWATRVTHPVVASHPRRHVVTCPKAISTDRAARSPLRRIGNTRQSRVRISARQSRQVRDHSPTMTPQQPCTCITRAVIDPTGPLNSSPVCTARWRSLDVTTGSPRARTRTCATEKKTRLKHTPSQPRLVSTWKRHRRAASQSTTHATPFGLTSSRLHPRATPRRGALPPSMPITRGVAGWGTRRGHGPIG
jgi:hypothetical protein